MIPTISLPLAPIAVPGINKPNTRFRLAATIATALVLFMYSGPLLRSADPAAAPVDPGILSLVLLAALALLAFVSISLWLLGLLWPVFRDYRKYHFSSNFKSLAPWQKIFFYLSTFFMLLYAFVYALSAVL
jgi:hypothetical protein